MNQALFTRLYNIPSGALTVKINYFKDDTAAALNFDVMEDIELEYGYEDEDQLTFYPNKCKLVFGDRIRTNFQVLQKSTGGFDYTTPENKMSYGGVELILDGVTKFKGYIDELSLEYNGYDFTTSFEVLDLTVQLRNMSVDRNQIIDEKGNMININGYPGNFPGMILPLWWYGPFKEIWSDFPCCWNNSNPANIYSVDSINSPGLLGNFIRHDWIFHGHDVEPVEDQYRYWSTINDFCLTFFDLDTSGLFDENRPCRNWIDYLKLIATCFGAIIGVMDYGKVYFIKRFGNNNPNPIDISGQVLDNDLLITGYLPAMRGSVVNNHINGYDFSVDRGVVERINDTEYKFIDKVKVLDTYISSYMHRDIGGGNFENYTDIYVYINSGQHNFHLPVWSVWDPALGGEGTAGQIYEILATWQSQVRSKIKNKIEFDAAGINYDMVSIYSVTSPQTNITINFRCMTLKKSLIKNQSHIVGIEI